MLHPNPLPEAKALVGIMEGLALAQIRHGLQLPGEFCVLHLPYIEEYRNVGLTKQNVQQALS